MLDLVLLLKAVSIGALVAAAVIALAARLAPRAGRGGSISKSACWTWAVGLGVIAASGATDQWPYWPALEDRARFLTILVPLTLLIETAAAGLQSPRVAWALRIGLAATVAPVLLFNTVYLADLSGPDSAEWTRTEAVLVFAGLALLLAIVWAALSALQARTSTSTAPSLLALNALATALTVMLSGYFRAGLLGLGLTGAIAGATLAGYFAQYKSTTVGSIGISVIGIFSVALMGGFFGALSSSLALCLLVAPLLAWIVELPGLRKLPPAWGAAARWACVAVPLAVVLIIAQMRFTAASAARSRSAGSLMTSESSAK